MPSFSGYTRRFGMPIVAPPPSGTSPAGHYAAFDQRLQKPWEVSLISGNEGVRVKFSSPNPDDARIYSMFAGEAVFIPAGKPLPVVGGTSTGAGSIVFKTWAADFPQLQSTLPPNVPVPALVIYGNVSASAFRAAMAKEVAHTKQPTLDACWRKFQSAAVPARAALETHYLDRAVNGEAWVFVEGRTVLGSAEAASSGLTELDLRFVDAGDTEISPALHLRSMQNWAGPEWSGHPLATAVAKFAVEVNIYAAFEVYNLTTRAFERLPADVPVDLFDYNPAPLPDTRKQERKTDAQGVVHFNFKDLAEVADSDLYFKVCCNGLTHAGHNIPADWSTKGWLAADDSPGYYENFTGSQIGDAAHPLVFRIGLDFHARLQYVDPETQKIRTAPANIPMRIASGISPNYRTDGMLTDSAGEIHGVSFQHHAEQDVWWGVDLETEDASRKLLRAVADPSPPPSGSSNERPKVGDFDSWVANLGHHVHVRNQKTSIGTHASPDRVVLRGRYGTGLFFLGVWRELSVFLWHMTGHGWAGIQDLRFIFDAPASSFSWPVGQVVIDAKQRDRFTVVHELAHQVMWQEAGYTSADIAGQAAVPWHRLDLLHASNWLLNPGHALIEGWADFVGMIFAYNLHLPATTLDLSILSHETDTSLYAKLGRGESVEGAFANALWDIHNKYVVDLAPPQPRPGPYDPGITPADDGNVDATTPWMTLPAAQAAFQSLFLGPLQDLRTGSDPKTTTRFIAAMRARNLPEWYKIRRMLAEWNLASMGSKPTSVTPSVGPASGGQAITISGSDFMEGSTVEIGSKQAGSVKVTSQDTITAVTPSGTAGHKVDVVVVNPPPKKAFPGDPIGRTVVPGGYEYQ